jgi:hypothetical protein
MIGIGIGLTRSRGRRNSITSLEMTGLTDDEAQIGDHASLSVGFPTGVTAWTSQEWGASYGAATYGTGASPTDYTAGDGGTLYWEGIGDDLRTYRASAPIRYAAGTAANALGAKYYAEDIAILSLANAGDFTLTNLTGSYSLAPASDALLTGLSLNATTAAITGTPTNTGTANLIIRFTDQYGRTVDSFGRSITVTPITFAVESGNLVPDIPVDTADVPIASITIDPPSAYAGTHTVDALGNPFSTGAFLALGSGVGLPITKPVIALTTDTGTPDELDSGDEAEVTRAALWAAADGDALSHTLSWRDSSGLLQANHSPYTGDGTEDTEIFARDVVGAVTVDSDPIPVVAAAGVSDPVLLDTKTIASLVGSTHTFASVDMSGAAVGDPIYFLVGFGGATATILSASMAGTTISTVRLENTTNRRVAIFKGARPAASSADFAVLMSGSSGIAGEALAVYKVVGANTDTVNSGQTSTNPVTFGVNTQIDDICLGGFIETRGTGSITLTGLSNTTTTTTTDDATFDFVTGWHRATTAETPRTFTGTMVGNGNAAGAVTVIAA